MDDKKINLVLKDFFLLLRVFRMAHEKIRNSYFKIISLNTQLLNLICSGEGRKQNIFVSCSMKIIKIFSILIDENARS